MSAYVKYPKPNARKPRKNTPAHKKELYSFCRHLTSLGYPTSSMFLRKKIDNIWALVARRDAEIAQLKQELTELKKQYIGLHDIEE